MALHAQQPARAQCQRCCMLLFPACGTFMRSGFISTIREAIVADAEDDILIWIEPARKHLLGHVHNGRLSEQAWTFGHIDVYLCFYAVDPVLGGAFGAAAASAVIRFHDGKFTRLPLQ